jgi:hypothetical protein
MSKAKIAFFSVSLLVAVSTLQAATIHIRVLDGRNGKPIADEVLQIFINDQNGASQLATGKDGVATLEVPTGASLRIQSNHYMDCRLHEKGVAPRLSYSVDEIISSGITAGNICRHRLDFKTSSGDFLFFIRPYRWWEKIWLHIRAIDQ